MTDSAKIDGVSMGTGVVEQLRRIDKRLGEIEGDVRPRTGDRLWAIAQKTVVAIAVPLTLSVIYFGFRLHDRVSFIENTRIPRTEVQEKLTGLQQDLIRALGPTQTMSQQLVNIEAKMDRTLSELIALRERVVKLENGK